MTSGGYTASTAWIIAETVREHNYVPSYGSNSTWGSPGRYSSNYTVDLVCLSISLAFSLGQLVASVWILFSPHAVVMRHAGKWGILQVLAFVVLVLAYLVPFSFDHRDNGHATVDQFKDKTAKHFKDVLDSVKEFSVNQHRVVGSYVLFLHLVVGVSGVVVVAVCCKAGKRGYHAVN